MFSYTVAYHNRGVDFISPIEGMKDVQNIEQY